MGDGISFDFSEVSRLAADLGELANGAAVSKNMRAAVQVTSLKVKRDAQESVSKVALLGQAAGAIHYETSEKSDGVEAEIGYDKGGVGNLGNLIEFGAPNAHPYGDKNAPNQPLPPHNDLANALAKNQGDFEKGLNLAAEQAERSVGL